MSSPTQKKESRYEPVDNVHDVDLENDSDTTLASTGFLRKKGEKGLSRRGRSPKSQNILVWFRWGSILAVQSVIVFLLLRTQERKGEWKQTDTETGGDVNGLYIPGRSFLSLQEDVEVYN
jgi:hypothetical protein